ncbi:MAG: enoyl-CoA hydratase/isomerase family protein [Candidatus Dormiibacterota bacterium]
MSQKIDKDRVLLDIHGPIATITLNRPEKRNALYPAMILRLVDRLEEVRRNGRIRALVLRGAGESFCAGDDLSPEDRFKYGPPNLQTRMRVGYQRVSLDLLSLRKPVIAMLRGYAVGSGFDLALACDFRVASPTTRFAAIYVKRGLGGGTAYLLPRYVGFGKATELLLRGEFVDIDTALQLNLVTEVVDENELEARTYKLAEELASGPTEAIGAIKIARNTGLGGDPYQGYEAQTWANIELMFHKDAREGPRAFAARRKPHYTGEWIDLQYDPPSSYD